MTEPLSPTAQAVLDAVTAELDWDARYHSHAAAAAALRAAADQVVSAEPEDKDLDFCFSDSICEWCQWSQRQHTRRQLIAMAAELEGAN